MFSLVICVWDLFRLAAMKLGNVEEDINFIQFAFKINVFDSSLPLNDCSSLLQWISSIHLYKWLDRETQTRQRTMLPSANMLCARIFHCKVAQMCCNKSECYSQSMRIRMMVY